MQQQLARNVEQPLKQTHASQHQEYHQEEHREVDEEIRQRLNIRERVRKNAHGDHTQTEARVGPRRGSLARDLLATYLQQETRDSERQQHAQESEREYA
ncbi:hypothetical protein ON010_g6893 [Phytophthora cinnamomi]|nr:hypothetical protein ON010_g6893 [Phytophthora cinnamomi]